MPNRFFTPIDRDSSYPVRCPTKARTMSHISEDQAYRTQREPYLHLTPTAESEYARNLRRLPLTRK